ncbi:MvdC/MvdD family ATP grasp protein [Nannocystis pusilla]|uniref:MvdD family ATP-grasp ribosomal peptide maturase n=1 Tax=Nannocystis pusilla TaxID=889268 RepID=A0ABS7TRA4_9BACT|nr:MvdD family ATP-grasp ribosomal peptide maturase [Nannocystis pusilla]MBZ5710736.1 MvdD family ATP-grasp ribosomal peptide maturase [Nannocystis pusilla]
MTVLIITRSDDNESSTRVAAAVEARGVRAYRLDTDLYPTELRISIADAPGERGRPHGHVAGPAGELSLADVTAVYYRRFNVGARIPVDLDRQLRAPSVEESRRVVHGLMAVLGATGAFALDRLDVVRRAEHKSLQLALARRVGLEVPRTLVSNDPAAVRVFAAAVPAGIVTKMMASFAVYDEAGREQVVFTNPVSDADLADLEGLDLCPMTFQERLEKACELRVTVVGDRVMAASIDSQALPRARNDWRREGVALLDAWKRYELPADVQRGTLALMDALGLNYGAFDFIVTPEGRHVFLEVNPVGEFMWLLHTPGLPIDEALADVLCDRAVRRWRPVEPA